MYFDIFIAVAGVLVVINVFVLFLLRRLALRAKRQIDANVVKQLSAYDELLEDKSTELVQMRSEAHKIELAAKSVPIAPKKPAQMPAAHVETKKAPTYTDRSFADKYAAVKSKFDFDHKEKVREICKTVQPNPVALVMDSILAKLDLDKVYSLMNLSTEAQQKELNGIFDSKEKKILTEYIKSAEKFDLLDFKKNVELCSARMSTKVVVRTGQQSENFDEIAPFVTTVYDPEICEGIVIICGEKIYDCSLQKKEICL